MTTSDQMLQRASAEGRAVRLTDVPDLLARRPAWSPEFAAALRESPAHDPRWLTALERGLNQRTMLLEATDGHRTCGILPLAEVSSWVFGRFLVSLPYLNSGGALAVDPPAAQALIDEAISLADRCNVRYLELRHEQEVSHESLTEQMTTKVHLRLRLPQTPDQLWKQFSPKVRNQVRKGERQGFALDWGGAELLDEFYDVFSRNMRDLGTPTYGRRLFAEVLTEFGEDAELCVVRGEGPVAAALLVHGHGRTDVPSASSLRSHNSTNANMLMYWCLLKRAIGREQALFDFGRSSEGSGTYRFKTQWGAVPHPAVWQYYVRHGDARAMRRENGRFDRVINLWKRLPVGVTRWLGPPIVRGIP